MVVVVVVVVVVVGDGGGGHALKCVKLRQYTFNQNVEASPPL